ncbi:MAG: TonB-dependent receptor [Verrucomicrobiota bacterium]
MRLTNCSYRWLAGPLVVLACLSSNVFVRGQVAQGGANDAVLLTVSGRVEVAPRGQTVWTAGHTNQLLRLGDRLRTGKNSRATLRLSTLSVLRVYELTTLEIQPPEQPGARAALDLESGAAYFFNRDKPSETQFRTPSASGAIRGTEFNLAVAGNGRMELALLDGQVDLTNNQGSLQVQTGQKAVVEPGQAPQKAPLIDAVNIIQWTLYYPAILDPDELGLNADTKGALGSSLDAYRNGDLLQALAKYPEGRAAASESERVYYAALLLAVGQVDGSLQLLQETNHEPRATALAGALQEMIASVKGQPWTRTAPRTLATEFLAGSYQAQAHRDLPAALSMAKSAAAKAPGLGFAQERLAEMEFSFGQTEPALDALDKGLTLSPRNAQALALKGFALSAQNKIGQAGLYFDQAIATDGALANGWLGRGLVRIRGNHVSEGRQDLETAAALEPNRAFLRSYLGKGWSLDRPFQYSWNTHLATNELRLAMQLDPNDPTAWLYTALLNDQLNCINQAINDLEHSEDLNGNRAVFRSKFLLDQDQAVRSANLALVYEDAGFSDVAVREATKALQEDYANYSAHLFLSETYDALQDPKREDLRYQTPWEDELLMANLLSPVGAGVLAQNVSQQEYSKLFAADGFGVTSETEFFSRGAWLENSSQYGVFGPMAYALNAYYYTDPGWRPNNYIDNSDYSAEVKYQITPKDTAFLEVERTELKAGDPFQYYDFNIPKTATSGGYDPYLEEYEVQDPNVLVGYHRDWGTGNNTLFLYRNLQDHVSSIDGFYTSPVLIFGTPASGDGISTDTLQRTTELNSLELQHIYQNETQTAIGGARYQNESMQSANTIFPPTAALLGGAPALPFVPTVDTEFERFSAYGYYQLTLADSLKLTGGLTYDWERYPLNLGQPPLSSQETDKGRLSPKVGLDWTSPDGPRVRAAFTRSMGGLINDSSTTIEPSQLAGFNQSFRSLIPQSTGFGTPPGLVFESYGLGVDHKFSTGTYLDLEAQLLSSTGNQLIGAYSGGLSGVEISEFSQSQYFQERDLFASVNQMIGKEVSVGARYSLTAVDLSVNDFSPSTGQTFPQHENSTLNEMSFFGNYYVPCGFFSQFQANWWMQHNADNQSSVAGPEPGADFWQFNLYAGYRFPRRHIEMAIGLVNIFNQGYNVDPVTYFLEQARNRTLMASLKFNF